MFQHSAIRLISLLVLVACGPDKGGQDTASAGEEATDGESSVGLIGEAFGGDDGPSDAEGDPADAGGLVGGDEPDGSFGQPDDPLVGEGWEPGTGGPGSDGEGDDANGLNDGTWGPGENWDPELDDGVEFDEAGEGDTGLGADGSWDTGAFLGDSGDALLGEQDGAGDGDGVVGGSGLSTSGDCACAQGASPMGSFWTMALVGLLGWRRRSDL